MSNGDTRRILLVEDEKVIRDAVAAYLEKESYWVTAVGDGQEALNALLEARATARKEKNFVVADSVRDGLSELGYVIEDTPQGSRVTRQA